MTSTLLSLLLATPILASGLSARDNCMNKCEVASDECRGRPGANVSTCVSDFESCESLCPSSGGNNSGDSDSGDNESGDFNCIRLCQKSNDECKGKPGANISTCVSDYANCESSC
ncbi:hypothetical protein PENSTE_c023G08152 [Penicillium steckii]|uniref:Uncharacterized protein n=1 Tax=Penicillium steckii TaxID=303698 RepID=A0A1V6SSS3_9EURO|nr:hypothetical protein PENSTE_c023G08152 [Penicillium steckii]